MIKYHRLSCLSPPNCYIQASGTLGSERSQLGWPLVSLYQTVFLLSTQHPMHFIRRRSQFSKTKEREQHAWAKLRVGKPPFGNGDVLWHPEASPLRESESSCPRRQSGRPPEVHCKAALIQGPFSLTIDETFALLFPTSLSIVMSLKYS